MQATDPRCCGTGVAKRAFRICRSFSMSEYQRLTDCANLTNGSLRKHRFLTYSSAVAGTPRHSLQETIRALQLGDVQSLPKRTRRATLELDSGASVKPDGRKPGQLRPSPCLVPPRGTGYRPRRRWRDALRSVSAAGHRAARTCDVFQPPTGSATRREALLLLQVLVCRRLHSRSHVHTPGRPHLEECGPGDGASAR